MKNNMNSNIEFDLPKDRQLIIELNRSIKDTFNNDVRILFYHTQCLVLTKDCFLFLMRQFHELLLAALHNQLLLDSSIKDIGVSWNKLLHEADNNQYEWDWQRYLLWETPGNIYPNLATWLYNDSKKNIILEITPVYPWHFTDPEANQEYISFDEFMKNYKPLFIVEVSRDTAGQWLKKISEILQPT